MVEGGGFEPPKAEPSDLQSDPFGHSGTPPVQKYDILLYNKQSVNQFHLINRNKFTPNPTRAYRINLKRLMNFIF